jgi:23S rRNA-/tRNA-specific pseudouridylate synthase
MLVKVRPAAPPWPCVKKWTVRSGDGDTVAAVLVRVGGDENAVRDGRVFLGRRRVKRDDEPVHPGDELTVAPPRADAGDRAVILANTGDLVAADKPAGIPTIPDHAGGAHSLVARVARTIGVDVSELHPTSRLDAGVSGVVVFTRTKAARDRLARARTAGAYQRRYVAISARAPVVERGAWDAPVKGVPSRSLYAVVARTPAGQSLLAVAPQTGRTHQIRIHASGAGAPLLGDRAYGGPTRVTLATGRVLEPGRIALHAARVVVPDADGQPLVLSSPIPAELLSLWSALGGDPAAWEGALACALD